MRKKRDRGGSDDGGEPCSKRQTTIVDAEPSLKKGETIPYDENKHGPIPLEKLDPNLQEIFKGLKFQVSSLEERTVDPEMSQISEYYCYRAESLALKTWEHLEQQVERHPLLARAVDDSGKPLAATLYDFFDADFLDEDSDSGIRDLCLHFVKLWRKKALLFLIERNPFCLIYKWGDEINESIHLLCRLALGEENLEPLCSAVCEDFSWLFDHPHVMDEEDLDPLGPIFIKMIEEYQANPDWVKRFFSEIYPEGLQTEYRRPFDNTLLHYFGPAIDWRRGCFDMELFTWFMEQNPQLLFQENQLGQSPMHFICKRLAAISEVQAFDDNALTVRRQVVTCIEIVLDRYPSAMSVKDDNGDTPLHKLCQGLNSMYKKIEETENDNRALHSYRVNLFDEHVKIVVESVELLMRRLPNLLHIQNNSHQYPIKILRHDKEPVQDLMISMMRTMYGSDKRQDSFDKISSNDPHPFMLGIQRCIQEEAVYAQASFRLKKSRLLIEKMPADPRKVIYRCWIDTQLNAVDAKIDSIREVDLRKLKALHRTSSVEA